MLLFIKTVLLYQKTIENVLADINLLPQYENYCGL